MDSNIESNLPKPPGVYGRSLNKDLSRMSQDIELQRAFAVFSRFKEVKSISHMAEVLKISHAEASDRLECLQNLNLVKYEKGLYSEVKRGFFYHGKIGTDAERKKIHSYKLVQIASLLKSSDRFSDLNITDCSTEEIISELQNDIIKALDKFRSSTEKAEDDKKNILLSLSLGYIEDTIGKCKQGAEDA